jgi:hypothetical protein
VLSHSAYWQTKVCSCKAVVNDGVSTHFPDEQHLANLDRNWGLDRWVEQPGRGVLYYPTQVHEFKRFGLKNRTLISADELTKAVDPFNNL